LKQHAWYNNGDYSRDSIQYILSNNYPTLCMYKCT